MKPKQSDISTVIIVNKSRQRTLHIKTKHISRLKQYAFSILTVIILLFGIIFYLKSKNQQQEQEKQKLITH